MIDRHNAALNLPLRTVAVLLASSAFGLLHAQEPEVSADAPATAEQPMEDELQEIVLPGEQPTEDELQEIVLPGEQPMADELEEVSPSSDQPIDDELEEIVLPSQRMFEDDPYTADDVDESILDVEDETDEQRLSRLFTLYLDAVSDSAFAEADGLGKQIVELTIRSYGLDSEESASALTNLAIAQHGMRDFESAIVNYNSAIGIIERIDNRLSRDLVNPLRGLGSAQLSAGRPDLARDAFNRAVHVSHVNDGPHNMEQIETLQSLAETYLSVGELEESVDIQKRIYYLQARNVGNDSMDIIPALRTRAAWQNRMAFFDQERFTWRRIISIIEDNYGDDSLELIDPLTRLGKSYLYVGFADTPYVESASVSSGEVYLKRAIRVAESNEEAGWQVLSDTMLELGDYYVMSARPNRGERVYEEIWEYLTETGDPDAIARRDAVLATPVVLQDAAPPRVYGQDLGPGVSGAPPGFETGTAVFRYRVSIRGRPVNIELMEADPRGLDTMYTQISRELRKMVYRPALADGQVVITEDVRYSHTFYYREADLPQEALNAQASGNGASN